MDEREDPTPVQPVPGEIEKNEPTKPPEPTSWRKFVTPKALAIIIPAIASAAITWVEFFRGEPEAKEAQKYVSGTIKNELAKMEKRMRVMHVRMVQIQADQQCENRTKAMEDKFRLEGQLMDANRAIKALKEVLVKKGHIRSDYIRLIPSGAGGAGSGSGHAVIKAPVIHCRKGYIEVKGKCKRVSKDVAETVQKYKGEAAAAKILVKSEKFKRKQAEKGKKQLKKLIIDKAAKPPTPMPPAPWEQRGK